MKAVMISIRPKWVKKILSGEKTVEVRKTAPNIKTPFKCYIYCALSGSNELFREILNGDVAEWNRGKWSDRKGNVVAEFVCDKISNHTPALLIIDTDAERILAGTCLTRNELVDYLRGISDKLCDFYGWHISDLKVYDKPRKITDFSVLRNIPVEYAFGTAKQRYTLERPPQSWCYVEELR